MKEPTATKDGTRCGGKKDASISMERSLYTFHTYRGRIDCTVYFCLLFYPDSLKTVPPQAYLSFSDRKFTVFLFAIADAL